MHIHVDKEIFEKYPETEIGYLKAKVTIKKTDPFVEEVKQNLRDWLESQGIDQTNFATHPSVACWRAIYENDFHVKAKTYRSSLEALIRRVVTGKELWHISNVVDLYNVTSIFNLLPMGGYDLSKISGDIYIRYAKEGEFFLPLGLDEKIEIKPNHVVYADDIKVMCWLWNHKDSRETCIDESTQDVIFFIDSFEHEKVVKATDELRKNLEKIGSKIFEKGVINVSDITQRI